MTERETPAEEKTEIFTPLDPEAPFWEDEAETDEDRTEIDITDPEVSTEAMPTPSPPKMEPAPVEPEPAPPKAEPPPTKTPPRVSDDAELEEIVFKQEPTRVTSTPELPPVQPRVLSKRRFQALQRFAEAVLPHGGNLEPSASEVGVAERVDASAARLDPAVKKRLDWLLTYWDWQSLFSRSLRRFSRVGPVAAGGAVERASHSRNPLKRTAFQFLKLLTVNQYAATPTIERAIGYTYSCITPDPPRDGAPLEVLSWPAIDGNRVEDCDAVVIGSGAGGSVVAKELAEAGLNVIVLEEGAYFTRADFGGAPWERLQRLYRANGTTIALGTPAIPLPMGRAVGGTTLVNSGTCFRTPDRVLERWGSTFGIDGIDPAAMKPYFDRVEKILHVKPVPDELLGPNARVFQRGVAKLGLHGAPIKRNIAGCRGCGVCAFGCPSDAKQATHISYLPRAQHAGATIYARCRARQIVVDGGRARGVVADLVDERGEPKATLTVRAKVVVIAAGAVHTPALLQANALANRSGQVGRNLRIHPAAGVGAFMEEDVFGWRGTLQPYYVDDWHSSHDLMIEVTSSVPSVGAGAFPGTGAFLKDVLGRYAKLASAGVFVSDTSSGRVRGRNGSEPIVTYKLNDIDTRKLVSGIVHLSEIFLAAGARQVFTGLPGRGIITTTAELEDMREMAVRPGAMKLSAFHPAGTARMGADPATTVVDAWGECHEVPGLFVADASVLPGCPTVNPQITIMGFATRTAAHMLERRTALLA
jgi:choline dehydrogenase-like flavoprotein